MIQFIKKSVSALAAFLLLCIGMIQPFPSAFQVYAYDNEIHSGDYYYTVNEYDEVTIT